MSNLVLIPIDNRPVCYELPENIVYLAKEHKIFLPDISLLGDLNKSANINKLMEYLENIEDIDIIVLSLDTIAYGGLIPSRRSTDSFDQIKDRIDRLVKIIKEKKAKVFAFSSIMRISNNNINEEEKEYWSEWGTKIFEYSYNLHKAEKENISAPKLDIPQNILNDYLATRKRNFEINKYYIELYEQGIFDALVFSKDDCAQYGLNVKEADILQELSKDKKGIFIKTGADEIPLTLISRALNLHKNIKISVKYTHPEGINKISKYEDISVENSVKSQIELAGGIITEENESDLILIVNNFQTEQGELVMKVKVPEYTGKLDLPNKPYFIADILNANGSDNNFVSELLNQKEFKNFYGYTAWNTTGNTLGSALAVALTYFGAKKPNNNTFLNLQLTRLLDDWAYQANVRAKIRNNISNLKNNIVQEEMKPYEKMIFEKFNIKNVQTKYSFPWNRFFELKILLEYK